MGERAFFTPQWTPGQGDGTIMMLRLQIVIGLVVFLAESSLENPQNRFDLGSFLTNGLGAAFNTALGRDCKGRPQGDYFYGCQCVGPFNIGRKRRSASAQNTNTRFFLNSNQGIGGDFIRCSVATVLNRNGGK